MARLRYVLVDEDDEKLCILLGVQTGVRIGVQESAHTFLVLLTHGQNQVNACGLGHIGHGHNLHLQVTETDDWMRQTQ